MGLQPLWGAGNWKHREPVSAGEDRDRLQAGCRMWRQKRGTQERHQFVGMGSKQSSTIGRRQLRRTPGSSAGCGWHPWRVRRAKFTVAMSQDGTLRSWGLNQVGELGNGLRSPSAIPQIVVDPQATGFLDLDSTQPNTTTTAELPPFLALAKVEGDPSRLKLSVRAWGRRSGVVQALCA